MTAGKHEATVTPYAGLKASCRHIALQGAVLDKLRFVIGTAIVGKTNQIQVIEYDAQHTTIQCVQTLSHADEIWWIATHPSDADLMITVSQKSTTRTTSTALYRVPPPNALAQVLGGQDHEQMELKTTLGSSEGIARRALFVPTNNDQVVVAYTNGVDVFDLSKPENASYSLSIPDVHAAAADSLHSQCLAIACGSSVKLWDCKSGKAEYEIADAHLPEILDVSFNDNKPWWVCTGGSDGYLRCWDMRVGKAACEFRASSHWVVRTLPSLSHEQLILTTGTDSKVRVFNASKFAYQNEGKLPDGEIIKSIRHDDSVYSAAWAAQDPWVFASVSYKGQVNVCQLPSQVVDSILMGDEFE
jgi:WD40 repeat protein